MSCDETRTTLHGYLDDELGLERALEFERHLQTCAPCAQELAEYRALRASMRGGGLHFSPPEALASRIQDSLDRETRTSRKKTAAAKREWPAWSLIFGSAGVAAVVVLLAVIGLQWAPLLENSRQNSLVSKEVLDSHLRSMLADHLFDVPSSDHHTVKPWFDGKLDFAPAVPDLNKEGFALAGGRLDYVKDRPVAGLVYRRRQHVINLMCWPQAGDEATKLETDHGYNLLHWTRGGMTYWVVSDLNVQELKEFASLVQHETSGAPAH